MCVCVCVLVCITKSKFDGKEIMVRSSRMFQISSVLLGCAMYQALLLVYVPVSVDGAELQTVSTTFLLFYTLNWRTAHFRMTVSKGKKLVDFRKLCHHSEYVYLFYDTQSVRAVQSCMAVLYETANWCYINIKNIILWIKFL